MGNEFLLFGERCSGTNVVQSLVEQNFNMKVSWHLGYKHWPDININWDEVDLPIVLVTRNPFSYFSSLYRKPWHAPEEIRKLEFSDFLRSEWWNVYNEEVRVSPGDDRYGKEMPREFFHEEGRRFRNVVEMRSVRLRQLAEIYNSRAKKVVVVDFEELRSDQDSVVHRISRSWNISPVYSRVRSVRDYKGSASWKRQAFNLVTFGCFRRKSVGRDIAYDKSDVEFIIQNLDVQVEAFFGYRPWVFTCSV